MGVTRPPLEYLASCSKVALESFELSRLNEASNYRKEVQQILQGWIDTEVDARLARWILESKQAQARDGLQAAMAQPVPLKQLDLSFLPSNGAQESAGDDGEDVDAKENTRKPSGPRLRRAAHHVLPCAGERTPEEPRKSFGMKRAKLLEKRAGGGSLSESAAARSLRKPPFAQDEENHLHELEFFVQRDFGASQARPHDLAAEKDSNVPDRMPRLAGHARRDAPDRFAEVHVFPSIDAVPAAAADHVEHSRTHLNVRTLIRRPGLERSRSKPIRSPAVWTRRVAPAV